MRLDRDTVERLLAQHHVGVPNGWGRCGYCWEPHPCDVYDLAADWLTAADALHEMAPKGRYWPVQQPTTNISYSNHTETSTP